jgi:hypothetical protein
MSASLARGSIATLSMPDTGTVAIRDFSSTLKLTLSDVYTCTHTHMRQQYHAASAQFVACKYSTLSVQSDKTA